MTTLNRTQTRRNQKTAVKVDINKVIGDADAAIALVSQRADLDDQEGAAENVDFYEGRHFGPSGEYWTGPQPENGDATVMAMIRREFASKNAIKEAVKSHRDGVISREPQCAFGVRRPLAKKGDVVGALTLEADEEPNPGEAERIRELDTELLTNWWNERSVLELLQEGTINFLNTRRTVFRIFVPARFLVNGKLPRAKDLADALSKIYLLVHTYDQAGVFTDRQTMTQVGVFIDEDDSEQTAEVTYLDAQGNTIIRRLTKSKQTAVTPRSPSSTAVRSVFSEEAATDEATPLQEAALPLGGRLMMYEMSAPEAFVSTQLREGNKSLNKSKTLRGHILNEAGFPETHFMGIALPGVLEDDPTREGGQKFIPDPIKRGARVINSWEALRYRGEDGKEQISPMSIHERDIPSLQAFIDCERADYQDMLEESGQVHKLMAGDAAASALSRIQAKAAFGTSLLPTVGKLNAAVRWIGETVAAYAALMLGEPGRYADLRLNADARVDTGPVLPDEVNVGLTLVEKKVWSRARLQRMTGVEDTQSEDEVILADEEKLNPLKPIQTERARLGLEADRRATEPDSAIRARLEQGAQTGEAVN